MASGDAPFTLTPTQGRTKENVTNINVITRDACQLCNTGWMSGIEQRTKPLLSPAIKGEAAAWNLVEQTNLATWAFKTGLMLDRSQPSSRKKNVLLAHFAHLFEEQCPSPAVQIMAARYLPRQGEEQRIMVSSVGSGERTIAGSYRIIFSVGQVVFALYGVPGLDASEVKVELSLMPRSKLWLPASASVSMSKTFIRLWPLTGEVLRWPPSDEKLSSELLGSLLNEPPTMRSDMPGTPWLSPGA